MSDEETKILSNEEKAKAPTTEPMLSAILARVNQISDDLAAFRVEVGERFDKIETEMREVKNHLHKVDLRLTVVSDDINKLRSDAYGHALRIDELERKAS